MTYRELVNKYRVEGFDTITAAMLAQADIEEENNRIDTDKFIADMKAESDRQIEELKQKMIADGDAMIERLFGKTARDQICDR